MYVHMYVAWAFSVRDGPVSTKQQKGQQSDNRHNCPSIEITITNNDNLENMKISSILIGSIRIINVMVNISIIVIIIFKSI